MATARRGLPNTKVAAQTYGHAELNALSDGLEGELSAIAELGAVGFLKSTDANATIVVGSLVVSLSAVSAAVLGADGSRLTVSMPAQNSPALVASRDNYIFLQAQADWTAEYVVSDVGLGAAAPSFPANSILACIAPTDSNDATSVNNLPTGRVNLRSPAYTVTNVTTDRTYDANATSTDELADCLGTLIADLKARGIIG